MSGIQSHTQLAGYRCSLHKRSDCRLPVFGVHRCVRLCIKFYAVGTCFCCIFNHLRICSHKNRSTYASLSESIHQFGQERKVCLCIPSRIGSNLIWSIGHERHLMRFYLQDQIDKLFRGVTFDIKFRTENRAKGQHIRITDMAFVGTGMNGYAFSPESFAIQRHFFYVGVISPTGITQGCHLVYIHT